MIGSPIPAKEFSDLFRRLSSNEGDVLGVLPGLLLNGGVLGLGFTLLLPDEEVFDNGRHSLVVDLWVWGLGFGGRAGKNVFPLLLGMESSSSLHSLQGWKSENIGSLKVMGG